MTAHAAESPSARPRLDALAVVVASAAIVLALVGLGFRPALLTPIAAVLALVSAGMSARRRRLAGAAVALAGVAWFVGMTIAVLTKNPLF